MPKSHFVQSSGHGFRFVSSVMLLSVCSLPAAASDADLSERVQDAMRQAASFFHDHLAVRGGYVYYYSLDLQQRWGEGPATATQIWVQPPGTPTVGKAFLAAHQATDDPYYLQCAREAAKALMYGQLQSGGWTNCIDFDPAGRVAAYRNGRGRGKNYSSLDDGQTQSAIQLLVRTDAALGFHHESIHESASFALKSLLDAQFPNGAFPQVWKGPVTRQPILQAQYPDYDWHTEGRIKNYWDMYTLNDNLAGYVLDALVDAYQVYRSERYLIAIQQLGDFLILAQMPDPQPAWAQQYNYQMHPIWARKFEPPAIASDESVEVIRTLMKIYAITGDRKYLDPIPRAIAYLKRSRLADARLARYYELKTNRPLYMSRRGDTYTLTYDDTSLPGHYMWKLEVDLNELQRDYEELVTDTTVQTNDSLAELEARVRQVLAELDDRGRWISLYRGDRLVGQPKFAPGAPYLSSAVFSRNIELLSSYLKAIRRE